MDDIQLLELAAKAAGYKVGGYKDMDLGYWIPEEGCIRNWNSLKDDGDALRLAVKLPHINVSHIIMAAHQQSEMEPCAYVRREITKAAAKIGRML
jgi:hypothetical protein